MNDDLASIHAYLCADGYVITNPPTQVHKYYYIGLRNTNLTLLKDFQKKFERVFAVKPIITEDVDRCKIQSKELCLALLKQFGTFYSDKWKMPRLTKNQLRVWLRSYFDCDGWVGVVPGKDRKVGLESINRQGLEKIKGALKNFEISCTIKKRSNRNIYALTICGKDDLERFAKWVGFLHPFKAKRLKEALESYYNPKFEISSNKSGMYAFLKERGRLRLSRNEIRVFSILKENLSRLQRALLIHGIKSKLQGPWKNSEGREYYCLILKADDINKLRR